MEEDADGNRFLNAFISETMGELFESPEALQDHYNHPESFERLLRGDIGENLMYKYRATASFLIWPKICAMAGRAFRKILLERGAGDAIQAFEDVWQDFHQYLKLQHAHGPDIDQIAQPVRGEFRYDIAAWIAAEMPEATLAFRFPEPVTIEFSLTEAGEDGLRAAFRVWSSRIQGLAKLVTRISTQWQVRRVALVSHSIDRYESEARRAIA